VKAIQCTYCCGDITRAEDLLTVGDINLHIECGGKEFEGYMIYWENHPVRKRFVFHGSLNELEFSFLKQGDSVKVKRVKITVRSYWVLFNKYKSEVLKGVESSEN